MSSGTATARNSKSGSVSTAWPYRWCPSRIKPSRERMIIALFAALLAVQPELDFRQALFEIVSAFGTVGLSTGITSELNTGARILVAVAMFLGRFGPLTLALLMAGRESNETYRFAEERVRIG